MGDALDALTSNPTQEGTVSIDGTEYQFETIAPTRARLNELDGEHPDADEVEWAYIMLDEFLVSFGGEDVDAVDDIPLNRALLLHNKIQMTWTGDVQAAIEEMQIQGNQ